MIRKHSWYAIPLTFLVALILTLIPMPAWSIWVRPAWLLMVLMYWGIYLPYRVNISTAWFLGMLLDVLNGTLLGEHALALTVPMYFVVRLHAQLRMYPVLQQALWVGLLVAMYQSALFCVQGFMGVAPRTVLFWSPIATSMVLWPWVVVVLRDYRSRFRVTQ